MALLIQWEEGWYALTPQLELPEKQTVTLETASMGTNSSFFTYLGT